MTNTNIKQRLHNECIKYVDEKIATLTESLDEAQQAANEETKSSMGDKYETGLAIIQLELEKFSLQLDEAFKLKELLARIDVKKTYDRVQPGSLVTTNNGIYFAAINAGEIMVDEVKYLTISLVSPLGKELLNMKAGDTKVFKNKTYVIESVI